MGTMFACELTCACAKRVHEAQAILFLFAALKRCGYAPTIMTNEKTMLPVRNKLIIVERDVQLRDSPAVVVVEGKSGTMFEILPIDDLRRS